MHSSKYSVTPTRMLACALAVGAAGVAHAKTIRVPANAPTIQAAIAAAQSGDEVLVAPGTYYERLDIYNKGVAITSEAGAEQTIIDAQEQGSVIVVGAYQSANSRVTGFTLRNGKTGEFEGGGGIRVYGEATVAIERNEIVHNTAAWGSGIFAQDVATVYIRHNHIAFNTGDSITLDSTPGSTTVSNNTIERNQGSGLVINDAGGNGAMTITANVIRFNNGPDGGGVRIHANSPEVASFVNNLIYKNKATRDGGGVYLAAPTGGAATFINNTIADNKAAGATELYFWGDGNHVQFNNNILRSSSILGAVDCSSGSPRFGFNDVFATQGAAATGSCAGTATGGTNFSADPLFASTAGTNPYSLQSQSPLIDVGDNAAVADIKRDRKGKRRVADGGHGAVVDLGAYEYQGN